MAADGRERLRAERSIWIDRDAASVFAYVTDLPRTPAWRTSVEQVQLQYVEPLGLGVRFGFVVAPVAARVMARDLGSHLARLKAVLERDDAASLGEAGPPSSDTKAGRFPTRWLGARRVGRHLRGCT